MNQDSLMITKKWILHFKILHFAYCIDDSTANYKFDEFLTNVNQLVDKHCPKKKLSKKSLRLRNKP